MVKYWRGERAVKAHAFPEFEPVTDELAAVLVRAISAQIRRHLRVERSRDERTGPA
jgi:hypothetical protein